MSYTPRAPPVKEGQKLSVSIEAIGDKGDGIARINKFVLVVPDTEVGKTYRVEVTRVLPRVAFAQVIGG